MKPSIKLNLIWQSAVLIQERELQNTLVEYQKAMEVLSQNRKAIEADEEKFKKKKEALERRSIKLNTLPKIPRIDVNFSNRLCFIETM